jgi:hypothetical protein
LNIVNLGFTVVVALNAVILNFNIKANFQLGFS